MASVPHVLPSSEFREALAIAAGATAPRAATSAPPAPACASWRRTRRRFPRRQMLLGAVGSGRPAGRRSGRLAVPPVQRLQHPLPPGRPARATSCRRSARMVVENLALPSFLGKLVGNVKVTLAPARLRSAPLLGRPPRSYTGCISRASTATLAALDGTVPLRAVRAPHPDLYRVLPQSVLVLIASGLSGTKIVEADGAMRSNAAARSSAISSRRLIDIATHKKFSMRRRRPQTPLGPLLRHVGLRRRGRDLGFRRGLPVQGLPSLLVVHAPTAPPTRSIDHWVKWLGNISAVALVVGGILLSSTGSTATTAGGRHHSLRPLLPVDGARRHRHRCAHRGIPLRRHPPVVACAIYLIHLGVVLTLFLTVPYSKFAHILYRTWPWSTRGWRRTDT